MAWRRKKITAARIDSEPHIRKLLEFGLFWIVDYGQMKFEIGIGSSKIDELENTVSPKYKSHVDITMTNSQNGVLMQMQLYLLNSARAYC
jgi:hypothetical protein